MEGMIEQKRAWGPRPIFRWLAVGLLILALAYAGYRVWRASGTMGELCEKNRDCFSRVCLQERGRNLSYCTTRCDEDADCPDGWKCLASPDFMNRRVCIRP
jgi:hypothetical protein